MSKKKYTCNWPLQHDRETYTDSVSLTAKEAEPLLAAGAISLPSKGKPQQSGDETPPGDEPPLSDERRVSDDEATGG